jgi:hypothetical protein
VVTVDRRKLAAPVLAQAAAFVVVLVIGGFTGHSAKPTTPAHQSSPSASTGAKTTASASSTSPDVTAGHGAKLTVKVVEDGTDGLSVSGSEVKVLQSTTLNTVASGTLSSALEFAANLPAGTYQVCVKPPIGWGSSTKGTHIINGYICGPAQVGSAPVSLTYHVTPQVPGQ